MDRGENERDYLQRRAEEEVALSQRATDPAAVAAHYRLSELYLERIEGSTPSLDGTIPCQRGEDDTPG